VKDARLRGHISVYTNCPHRKLLKHRKQIKGCWGLGRELEE
jgi:hypothetical protein